MAEDSMAVGHLHDLESARAVLVNKRLSLAQTIGTRGDVAESAIKGIIDVQQAIEVIDIAIEELEEEEMQKELDETEAEAED